MKVRQAYERAMALINERDSGGAYHSDVRDFENNTPEFVNTAVTLLWLDDCVIREVSVRDISWDFQPVTSMEDTVPLHDALASGVLPFLLASLLLLEEDHTRAEYFYRLYTDAKLRIMSAFATARRGSVKNVY